MNFKNLYKKYAGVEMESSAYETAEFKAFVAAFTRGLKAEAKQAGLDVVSVLKGHFELSGFLRRKDGRFVYFSVGDMRWGDPLNRVLYRFAKDEHDYRGEINRYAPLYDLIDAVLAA